MLTISSIFLLLSNAVTLNREKSILYSRIVIKTMLLTIFIAYINLHVKCLENGIGIFGSLFNVTTFTQSFNIFILLTFTLLCQNGLFFELTNQIKGYFYINPFIFIILPTTLFSFVGIPPIMTFFFPNKWFNIVNILTIYKYK